MKDGVSKNTSENISIKSPSVKKNFLLSTAYQVLCIITPFVTAPYLARVLGAEKIGVNSYIGSIIAYFTMFGALGTISYGAREIARVRDDVYARSKTFWEIELLSVCTSGIAIIAWAVFVYLSTQYKVYYFVLTLNILGTMFDISWFYSGMEQFKYTVTKNTVIKIIGIVLVFIFVKTKEHLFNFVLINSACGLFGNVSMWLTLKPFLVKVNRKDLHVFKHFKGTFVFFVPVIATSIYTVLDKTLIGVITHDKTQNGFYEQAHKIIQMVKTFTFGPLNSVLESRSSYLFVHEKFDEIKAHINKSLDFIMLVCIGSVFGILGVADHLVPIFFGEGYEASIPLLKMFSPVLLITGITVTLGSQYYTPSGKRFESAIYIIIGAVVNLICNVLLIPRFQSMGAVIGTIISEFVITVLFMIFCKGYVTLGQIFKVSWKRVIAGLIMFAYLLIMDRFVEGDLLCLIIQVVGGSLIYGILLLLMRDQFLTGYLIPTLKNKFFRKKKATVEGE